MKNAFRKLTRNQGYTLYELLGYAVLLLVIMNLSASILIGTKRLHTLGTLAIERNEALEEVARDFREAVHGASRIAESVSGLSDSPGAIVLESKSPAGKARYCLWRRDAGGRFYFDEYEDRPNGKLALVSRKVYPASLKVLDHAIARESESDRLIKLDLVIDNEGTRRTVPKSNRFIAAMRQP